ncbi:protein FAR-RED ELONGATED HYPOCOTYL 3-like [Abrus precatorius]|uniref:Protein FAR-RED ELONGATED HYPOCOTYL 3-like n=1 Tax=Abrus precatorius TaxID=3816 RepID=A0A8B8KVW5_ABRPR|nr:protein FAR-RED ELONGATED HYPOCOTYL 3-like [Abrus precatorius]
MDLRENEDGNEEVVVEECNVDVEMASSDEVGMHNDRMLRSHCKMDDSDVEQMQRIRKSSVATCKIYNSFVNQRGSYDMVGFCKKDMYNQIERNRRGEDVDVKEAEKFFIGLRFKDPKLYWGHKVDSNGRLLHMFWCNGISQIDYDIFRDVVAFDATCGRNKYKCPVDKCPNCVITDSDISMRNTIRKVFLTVHHRLYGRHLMRNVTCNVYNERFSKLFKECMLGDLDIKQFEQKWASATEECHLGGNVWVEKLYKKKEMWCTTYIIGKFFVSLRTTSRYEGLHSQIVQVYLQVHYLPSWLVLNRWTKMAKRSYKQDDNQMVRNGNEISLRRSWFGLLCESGRSMF